MRKLNTSVHVNNDYIRDQFEEINNEVLRERHSFGIVSDTKPNKEDSPLAVSIVLQKVSIFIEERSTYIHGLDSITLSYTDARGIAKLLILEETENHAPRNNDTVYWSYGSDRAESLLNLKQAINSVSVNLKAYIVNDSLLVYGISAESGFKITNGVGEGGIKNDCLGSTQNISIMIKGGTAVFPNKNAVTFKERTLTFPNAYLYTNDIYLVCLKYIVVDGTKVTNEFGEEVVKNTEVSSDIVIEDAVGVPDENTLCIAVVKANNNSIHLVDTEGHNYYYNRPWYSPKDVEHRNDVGTSKITEHNPHGIDYDDIDSDNTLHNRLLEDGVVVTPQQNFQDIPGVFLTENISGSSIVSDVNGMFSQYDLPNSPARFYCLKYTPIYIHKIVRVVNGVEQEIYLKWIKGTPYLLCNALFDGRVISISDDIRVSYSYSKTAQPTIQKTQGILISSLYKDDVLFSEGKNVRLFDTNVDIFHKTNINRYYFASIDKQGNIVTTPSVLVNEALTTESSSTSDIRERSRLAIFLYNTTCASSLDAPTTGVSYTNNKELNLFKTNISYTVKDNVYTPSMDSYTSPIANVRTEAEESEWLEIDMSNDYDSNGNRVTKSLHCLKKTVHKDSLGKIQYLDIRLKKGVATHVKGYVVIKGTIESTSISLYANAGNSSVALINKRCDDKRVTFIKIDDVIPNSGRVESDNYVLYIGTQGDYFVQDVHLEFSYDETMCRYFINQKEGDEEVTRLLYDPTKDYRIYGLPFVVVEGNIVKIKKEVILYDYLPEDGEGNKQKINENFFPKSSIKTNSNFSVDVTVYGEANRESVSENITFDGTFREQYGFNYKLLNNAFTSVSKYTVNNSTSDGSILILAYPLSNYLNPARLIYVNYEEDKMKDYRDIRLCVSNIQDTKEYSSDFIAESNLIL